MALVEIQKVMAEITKRRSRGAKEVSNFFPGTGESRQKYEMLTAEKTVVFWSTQPDVTRAYFHSMDGQELTELLKKTPTGAVIDYICKEGQVPKDEMIKAGYKEFATYSKRQMKLTEEKEVPPSGRAKLLYDLYNPECGVYAQEDDVVQIEQLLHQYFDIRCDHIYSREELLEMVQKKEAIVYKLGSKIECFYLYKREGRRIYSAFSYNNVTADILYSIERRVREEAQRDGMKVMYAWFHEENRKALRRTAMVDTGIRDYIFIKG